MTNRIFQVIALIAAVNAIPQEYGCILNPNIPALPEITTTQNLPVQSTPCPEETSTQNLPIETTPIPTTTPCPEQTSTQNLPIETTPIPTGTPTCTEGASTQNLPASTDGYISLSTDSLTQTASALITDYPVFSTESSLPQATVNPGNNAQKISAVGFSLAAFVFLL